MNQSILGSMLYIVKFRTFCCCSATHSCYVSSGKPVEVTVEIKVVSLGELNEANMVWFMDY